MKLNFIFDFNQKKPLIRAMNQRLGILMNVFKMCIYDLFNLQFNLSINYAL